MDDIAANCAVTPSRRAGGRAARVAARSAPLAENLRPIRPGLPGGQYKPLTEAGVKRIHEAALEALEVIGLSQAPESGIEVMTKAGAILGDDGEKFGVCISMTRTRKEGGGYSAECLCD